VLLDDRERGCRVTYTSCFLPEPDADRLFAALHAEAPFETEAPRLFGQARVVRRRTCSYGEPGVRYRYSGLVREAAPWHRSLFALLGPLRERCAAAFNYALCQVYPDGAAGIGWHADDERDLAPEAPIASLSLGAARDFQLRLGRAGGAVVDVLLAHGSLLVMAGKTQRHYQHQLPPRVRCVTPRINLTFRVLRTG
jgi:alkylated DNA repair dioxygenase AlkB